MVVSETKPVLSAPSLRKKALIEAVTARSGIKRKDVKPTIEAMLAVLGEAIAEGRDINLPDLGKFKITRSKKLANGEVFTVRIRQPKAKPAETPDTPKDPLAEAAE
jgi:nucleoid DNA-binding protein